jgi:hypothetical protein
MLLIHQRTLLFHFGRADSAVDDGIVEKADLSLAE